MASVFKYHARLSTSLAAEVIWKWVPLFLLVLHWSYSLNFSITIYVGDSSERKTETSLNNLSSTECTHQRAIQWPSILKSSKMLIGLIASGRPPIPIPSINVTIDFLDLLGCYVTWNHFSLPVCRDIEAKTINGAIQSMDLAEESHRFCTFSIVVPLDQHVQISCSVVSLASGCGLKVRQLNNHNNR